MREVALKRAAPASIRLMDNLQFQLGHCLTPEKNVCTPASMHVVVWVVVQVVVVADLTICSQD
jgi:hypothetical protein